MSESAAAAESPVTPSSQDAAIALLRGASAEVPATPAETAAPETPAAAPAPTPAPTPEAAPADDVAELISALEARAAQRASKQQPDAVAQLQAKIDALEARLAQPTAPAHPDFAALVREHGHVKAMEIVGLDPLEYFDKFKQVARDPAALDRARAQRAEADRLAKLEEQLGQQGKTLEQWKAEQAAKAEAAQWNAYVSMVADPSTGTPLLAKLPPADRVERTQRKIAQIHEQYGAEAAAQISDVQLAKLVERDIRSLRDLLAGIDPSATPTPQVPATDGARQPATATLSNDLASQASGQTRPLSEEERVDAAIKLLKQSQG